MVMIGWVRSSSFGWKRMAGIGIKRWLSVGHKSLESQNCRTQVACRHMISSRWPLQLICGQYSNSWALPSSFVLSRWSFSVFSTFSREIIKHEDTPLTAHNGRNVITHPSVTSTYGNCVLRRPISEDRKTTAVTVWSDLVQIKSSPLPALVLGFSGLIPFVSAPAYFIFTQSYVPAVAFAQTAYGAIILSFLGGVRWGITLPEESLNKPDWRNLSYSILPSLVAWTSLLCAEPIASLTVMAGLAVLAYFDTTIYGYPPWFKALRFLLSLFAVLSLWTTFVCRFLLDSKTLVDGDKTEVKTL